MSPVALVLGSGTNVGGSVAKLFVRQGYKVAVVSRSATSGSGDDLIALQADLSRPESIVDVFKRVKDSIGAPEVVIYNAGNAASGADKKDPLALPVENLKESLDVNTIGAFAAAQEAVKIFKQLPESASRTFLYTGNILNSAAMPGLESLGMGKSASAHFIQSAAAVYAEQGLKFYYCDERKADGRPAYMDIDGEAHAKLYYDLAETPGQGPWLQTFVKGVGYQKF